MAEIINIQHSDIIYAVRNKTHKIGKSAAADPRAESNMQADDTTQDTKIVSDSIDKAIGNVIREMSKYVADTLHNDGMTTIVFAMPATWRSENKNGMITDIYNFIVDFCVFEFMTTARRMDEAKTYLALANASLANAKKKMLDKKSPI